MKGKPRIQTAASCVTVALLLSASALVMAKPSNKWRLEFDGRAKTAGEIELSIVQGGAPTTLVVPIAQGTSENAAARQTRDLLRATFGKSVYKVEVDDGEDVLIKAKRGTANFEVAVVRNTADGLKTDLERE